MAETAISLAVGAILKFVHDPSTESEMAQNVMELIEGQSVDGITDEMVRAEIQKQKDLKERRDIMGKCENISFDIVKNRDISNIISAIAFGLYNESYYSLKLTTIRIDRHIDEDENIDEVVYPTDSYDFDKERTTRFLELASNAFSLNSKYVGIEIRMATPNMNNLNSLAEFEYLMLHAQRISELENWGRFDLREDGSRLERSIPQGIRAFRIYQEWARVGTVRNLANANHTKAQRKIETIAKAVEQIQTYYGSNNIFIVGRSGVGKSTLANKLSERDLFYESSVGVGTHECKKVLARDGSAIATALNGVVNIWDTPGIKESKEKDLKYMEQIKNFLKICGRARAMIIVFSNGRRCNDEEVDICLKYIELWGEKNIENVLVLINENGSTLSSSTKAHQKVLWSQKITNSLNQNIEFNCSNIVHTNVMECSEKLKATIQKIARMPMIIPEAGKQVYRNILELNSVNDDAARRRIKTAVMRDSSLVFDDIADKMDRFNYSLEISSDFLKISYSAKFFRWILKGALKPQEDFIRMTDVPDYELKYLKWSLKARGRSRYVFRELVSKNIALIKVGGSVRKGEYEMFPIDSEISERVLLKIKEYLNDPQTIQVMAHALEEIGMNE